jgi:hypothetical protein
MRAIVPIVVGTPLWVWALLALLVLLGVRALRSTTTPLWRAAILPAGFFVWGLSGLLASGRLTMAHLLPWAAALASGALAGLWIASLRAIRVDKLRHLIETPGSPLTLVLGLLIFAAKYAFGALHAVRPALFAAGLLPLTELAVSGVLTGMFVGRFAGLWGQYGAAPHVDLA